MSAMERLSEKLVFVRTETGRAELASHALLADKPMQFLLLMINGKRDLSALRSLSQILQDSDQPVFTLLEKDLVEPVAIPAEPPADNALGAAQYAAPLQAQSEAVSPVDSAEARHVAQAEAAAAPALAQAAPTDPLAEPAPVFTAPQTPAAAPACRPDTDAVALVAALLQKVLGRDAEDMVTAIKRIDSAGEFNASVRRLEHMLRQSVSGGMAEELRNRIPAAFE